MEGIFLIATYLIGAIPFGYLLGKWKGLDVRQHGSGNIGATNVARVLGKKYGIVVFILDFLKGFIPTYIAVQWFGLDSWMVTWVGLAAVSGHMFTPFLGFRGGKGVATSAGVLFGISPILGLITLAVWFAVYKLGGYVSVGSISAAFFAMFLGGMLGLPKNILLLIGIVAVLILIKHKSNIERLIEGKELKV